MNLNEFIRDVPDFPKPGIIFKDITPLLNNPQAFTEAVKLICKPVEKLGITHVVGIESRGFIFGTPVAIELGASFVPVRKPGKLPCETLSESYSLEYGTDSIEIHKDALGKGDRVLLVDDLLATGGTMSAAVKLVEKSGAQIIKIAFVIELAFLKGREKIACYDIATLLTY
ncbi:MAG: adenine phosphoribosyltransferase [Candidatus Latescibacteria bacterium]|jgi:adenine phosphoribosyltransferase|nr:adenine phosphoribosyltransferase [Candidatus Latescibacterota bacterium]